MKFSDLVQHLGPTANYSSLDSLRSAEPPLNPEITGVGALDQAAAGMLSFVESRYAKGITQTKASALILPDNSSLQAQAQSRGIAWIATTQPRLLFAQAIALFYEPWRPQPSIHPTAVIDPTVQVGEQVFIGPHVMVAAGAQIGNAVCIHANGVIYPDVQIGDRTILHANCVIHERTQVGMDCVVHSGAVIGAEGFGFVPTREGWLKMQQSGHTVLEDGVEVGCNTAIDRPAVGETRVAAGTKIDNLVQIGHGCQIGRHCAIAAQVGLAGGVKLGNHVILAGQAGVNNQVKVGNQVTISAKAGVVSNVESGQTVSGYPAIPHKMWLKAAALYSRLPDLYQTLKQIQRRFDKNG